MYFQRVPHEIVALVADNLDLDDIYSLSVSCKQFSSLLYDQAICKRILQATRSSALEAQQACSNLNYSREVRRFVKRREAISSVSPFLTALVAFAESWRYEKGVLCHIRDKTLRLLDIHNSADREIVVNTDKLLDEAVPESRGRKNYKFQLIHQSDGVVSCLYSRKEQTTVHHWLIVFDPAKKQILTAQRLSSTNRIFVRNNSQFLLYGTHSEEGDDGFDRWVLRSFDIPSRKWNKDPLPLPDTVGSDIGQTICFEIIDGYFYVLANSTSFETNGREYTSYYDFFRFPLDNLSHEHLQSPTKRDLFRRQSSEGVIDDRWTFLKVFKDETSGLTRILESRKEWLSGGSSATRSYYMKTVSEMDIIPGEDEGEGDPNDSDEDWDSDDDDEDDQFLENDRLGHFFSSPERGNKEKVPERHPTEVHVGDDGSTSILRTLSQCFIRSYHPSSQTFMDLVDDPQAPDYANQRIRVRAGARRLRAPADSLKLAETDSPAQTRQVLQQQIDSLYEQSEVVSWPPDTASPAHDDLHKILNPPGYRGNVHGTWDDRSMVYATGGASPTEGLKALVLVSFDPGVYLKGVRSFAGQQEQEQEQHDVTSPSTTAADLSSTLQDFHTMLSLDEGKKGKERESSPFYNPDTYQEEFVVDHNTSASSGGRGLVIEPSSSTGPGDAWAWTEPAQYLSIAQGFHFAQ